MALYRLEGAEPEIHPGSWSAPTAVLIGRVRLKRGASVWWNAVLRGDNEWIEVGEGANVQDGCICHTDPGCPLTVGADATVGHRVILHGCTVEAGSLVGMGAVVLNNATIGAQALLGAGALVPEGKTIPPRTLAVGAPARVIRDLTEEEIAGIAEGSAGYVGNWQRYLDACQPT
jgi:carbonic anhydrase/acetyltransferase-like protein (isoleucine patch superfamily)